MRSLRVAGLSAYYHGVMVIDIPRLSVGEGELVGVIGPNGVGKTSLLKAIAGVVDRKGSVEFDGVNLASLRPSAIIRRGVVLAPEGRQLFPEMTVLENLRMGAFLRGDKAAVREDLDMVWTLFPVLADRRGQNAGTLSGGEQQMCAIGRALMSGPRLLMLDEPSFGLAPMILDGIAEVIRQLNDERGLSMLLVEQNVSMALELATRMYILEDGRIAREGSASELGRDAQVRQAYLGLG